MAKEKGLERRIEPIRLRPHHWDGIIEELAYGTLDEHIRCQQQPYYGKRFIDNYLRILHKIASNHEFKVVPALDSICARCSPKYMKSDSCSVHDYQRIFDYKDITFELPVNKSFTPLGALSGQIDKIRQWLERYDIFKNPSGKHRVYVFRYRNRLALLEKTVQQINQNRRQL